MCVCVCHGFVLVQRSMKNWLPWLWGYRQVSAAVWVLGTELGCLGRAASTLNCCAISPALDLESTWRLHMDLELYFHLWE